MSVRGQASTRYLQIWKAQAARDRKRNPSNRVQVDIDIWIALLAEVIRARRKAQR